MQPRHDIEAEKAVIGAVLYDQRVMDEFTISPDDFYQPTHEQLWRVMVEEARAGRPVQTITILQRLTADPIPGMQPTYLHECISTVTTSAVAPHYADIVKGLANLRRIAETGGKLMAVSQTAAWDGSEQVLDDARAELDRAANSATGIKITTFADALQEAVDLWAEPQARGMATGWPDLDDKLNGGWQPGQLTIIGARPAVGKSVVAGCAAVAAAEHGAAFFSLEMRKHEVVARMAAAAQGIRLSSLNSSDLTQQEWDRVGKLAARSASWPVYIEDNSMMSMAQIRAHVRTMKRRGPLPVVIIDYLQLVTPADRSESRERQVSRIAEDCKHLAKEFDTHVIALAQVNRASVGRQDPRPTMSDLRESGGIEAFADNIILLHRDPDNEDEIEFIIGKNRHGQTGSMHLVWRPHFASVNSMAQDGGYRHGVA